VRFEWDPAKSAANLAKHGLDFATAARLWDAPVVYLPSRHGGEPRQLAVGRLSGRMWTAIVTRRGDALRLISVRRSRREEEQVYEEKTKDHDEEP
jgi:hypothetical protein